MRYPRALLADADTAPAAEKKAPHKEPPAKKDLEAKKNEILKKLEEDFYKEIQKGQTDYEDKLEEQLANELIKKPEKKEISEQNGESKIAEPEENKIEEEEKNVEKQEL